MEIVRAIFSGLDRIVYGLIKWLLFGIFDLAHLTTNSDVFNGIYSRIYVILGIFMAFKLSFSFFQYIIDPESMTGKSDKSITKVISRMFIMLVTLIFLPTILFGTGKSPGLLARAQDAFLPSLPKIIFGVTDINGLNTNTVTYDSSSDTDTFTKSIEQSSEAIAVNTIRGFFQPVPEIDVVCGDGTYEKTPQITTLAEFANNVQSTCQVSRDFGWWLQQIGDFLFTSNDLQAGGEMLKEVVVGTKYYKYSYQWGISTVVGVLVLLLLVGITIDVAKRVFKLIVLEAIAPIPIMSLVDPKASKDGAFGKWVKSLTTTFLDIFLKLGLVYLIIVLIQMITTTKGGLFANFPENAGFRTTYLTVLLILGLIFFAKEAPKFIKDALGIKDSGGGLFDDVKTIGKAAGLVGGAAVGAAGVVGSTVGSVRAQHQANKTENDELGKSKGRTLLHGARNVGAALSGAVGGTAAGVKGLTGKNAGIASVMKAQQDRNAADFARRREGGTFFGGVGSGVRQAFTGETGYDALEREWNGKEKAFKETEEAIKGREDAYKHNKEVHNQSKSANAHRSNVMKRCMDMAEKSDKTKGTVGGITGNYQAFHARYTQAQNGYGIHKAYQDASGKRISKDDYDKLSASSKTQYSELSGNYFTTVEGQEVNYDDAYAIDGKLKKANAEDYYAQYQSGAISDDKIDVENEIHKRKTGADLEGTYADLDAAEKAQSKALDLDDYNLSQESEKISAERAKLNADRTALEEEKRGFAAQRAKANGNRYSAKKGK